ncbi:MAG TPA: hypothetical protein VK157_16580 [Phycisphaerales bacterium]|nr:hypothetical protein [Phycisphaerales bacterium]
MSVSQFFNWIGNNLQLIFFILIFAAPAIGKVLKKMNESRQLRLEKLRRERAEIDALRTGGRIEPVRTLAQPSANQLAQQAAEERRRRAQQVAAQQQQTQREQPAPQPRTTMGPVGSTGQRTRLVRLPGGIVLEVPDESAEPQPTLQPTPQRAPDRTRREKKQRPQPTPRPAQPSNVPEAAPIAAYAQTAPATSAEAFGKVGAIAPRGVSTATKSRGTITFMGQPATREQLRKAVVLAEVFGRPASER